MPVFCAEGDFYNHGHCHHLYLHFPLPSSHSFYLLLLLLLFLFYILFMFPAFFICFLPFLFLSVTQLLKFEQQTFFLPFSCPLVSLTLNSRSLILSLNLFHFKFFFAVSSIITHLFPFPFLSLFFHCFNFPFLRVFIFFPPFCGFHSNCAPQPPPSSFVLCVFP